MARKKRQIFEITVKLTQVIDKDQQFCFDQAIGAPGKTRSRVEKGVFPMVRSSYSDVFDISHERDRDEHIAAGDLVRTGANAFPHYRVIAVYGDKVWVRDIQYGSDGITNLSLCRKVVVAELVSA